MKKEKSDVKKVMILGAGRGQVGLYKAAKAMGTVSISVSIDGDYPGFEHADIIEHADILDKDEVLKLAKKHDIDAIVSACIDLPVPTIGYVCDTLGLRGISYEAAIDSTNKLLMKKAFEKFGVRTARFVRVSSDEDSIEKSSHLNMPLIVKPVDLAGSKGINIVKDKGELQSAVNSTMADTKEEYCIIEEYIDGYEFSATALVADGEIIFILPTGDVRYGDNDEIPAGHYLPYEDDDEVLQDTLIQMEKGIRALNLNNCAVNADLMRMDGKVYIIEMTGRLGANCIPELTSIYTGYDINAAIIQLALGETGFKSAYSEDMIPKTACHAQMLVSDKSGKLKEIIVPKEVEAEADILLFSKPGDEIRKFATTSDCLGQVVASGTSLKNAKDKADDAAYKVEVVLEDLN